MFTKSFKQEGTDIWIQTRPDKADESMGMICLLRIGKRAERRFISDQDFNNLLLEGMYGVLTSRSELESWLIDPKIETTPHEGYILKERENDIAGHLFSLSSTSGKNTLIKDLFMNGKRALSMLACYHSMCLKADFGYRERVDRLYLDSESTKEFVEKLLSYISDRKQTATERVFSEWLSNYCSKWLTWMLDRYHKCGLEVGERVVEREREVNVKVDQSIIYLLLFLLICILIFFLFRFMRREKQGFVCLR